MPSECREMIRRGALVALNHSGGKDSQAMTILLSRIVPREQTIVVHAPLGEVEWPATMAQIEATIPEGVPLILAPVTSGKSLLDRVEERGKWPDPARRWCTSDFKASPIARELRRYLKAHPRFGGRLVNCLGLRRDESHARAKRSPWRRNDRMSVAGREVFDWLPIFDLSTADVFDVIRDAGQSPHWIYDPPVQVFVLLLTFSRRLEICAARQNSVRPFTRATRRLNSASATPCRRRAGPCRT